MRTAWRKDREYSVICHTAWEVKTRKDAFNQRALKAQPDYMAAKKSGDMEAAQMIIDRLLTREGLEKIKAKLDMGRFDLDPMARRPVVLAPVSATSKNVLPTLTAHNIAYQLGLGVDRDIIQIAKVSRTNSGPMSRLLNIPEFAGHVTPGREYVLVDDNYTMGGTLAALRSYIEENRGKVLCASVLADQSRSTNVLDKIRAHEIRWDVSPEDLKSLGEHHGWQFEKNFEKEFGFGVEVLTKREASFIRSFSGQRALFAAAEAERSRVAASAGGEVSVSQSARAPVIA